MATIAGISVDIGANLNNFNQGVDAAIAKLKSFVGATEKIGSETEKASGRARDAFGRFVKGADQAQTATSNLGNIIKGAFTAEVVLKLGEAVIGLGQKVVTTFAAFEKLGAVLSNTLGSKTLGALAQSQLQKFAEQTPSSLLEATTAFLKLQNAGIKPTISDMKAFSDIAANAGKGIDFFAEAVNDAARGEFERLKEFFIDASAKGDKVTFTFNGLKTTVDKNSDSIKAYLVGLGQLPGVLGAGGVQMDTVSGKLSNMNDAFDNLFNTIGKGKKGVIAGTLDFIIEKVNAISNSLQSVEDRGLANAAGGISKQFESIQERFNATAASAKDSGGDIAGALNEAAEAQKAFFSPKLAEAQAALNKFLEENGSTVDQVSRNLRHASDEQKVYEGTLAKLSGNVELFKAVLGELPNIQQKAIKSTEALTTASVGLIAGLEKQITAQKAANEAASDTGALSAGQATLKTLNEQLDALQKLGTQNSLEVVTDKLEKYYEILGNPDATNAAVANAAKEVKALESVREALQNDIDARVKLFNIPVPASLKNLKVNSSNPNQSLSSNDVGTTAQRKAIEESFKPLNIQLLDPEKFLSEDALKAISRKFKDLEIIVNEEGAGVVDASEALSGALTGTFQNLGELLGDALSGALDGVGNAVARIGSLIANFMKSVGSALIAAGVAKIAFDKLKLSAPAAIAAGIALIAASVAVEHLFASPPKLATGTNYFPSDGLAYLHEGEAVVPKKYNPYINGGGNSGGWGGMVEFVIQGETLKGVLRKYDQGRDRRG